MGMNAIGRIDEIKNNEKPISPIKSVDEQKKFKEPEIGYALNGIGTSVAFMPAGGIGSLLNGSKQSDVGAFQA